MNPECRYRAVFGYVSKGGGVTGRGVESPLVLRVDGRRGVDLGGEGRELRLR